MLKLLLKCIQYIMMTIGGFIGILIACFLAVLIFSIPSTLANNRRLGHLEQEFLHVEHPKSTEQIKHEKLIGLLDGNADLRCH